ncbi:hypothetical protein KK060_12435 [Fulvivirgaceae bacterium PWU20]|uniref:Uncharacterized protein n=1 Tax=Chryseosolibacter indicus TaxID=2782351 RepID=A0ABS5VTD7_9BACT|nr:hypothetical protein [Chryseosolibacter indicus]
MRIPDTGAIIEETSLKCNFVAVKILDHLLSKSWLENKRLIPLERNIIIFCSNRYKSGNLQEN